MKCLKQVLGYFISSKSVTGVQLKYILTYTIEKLNNCGLIPKVIICDQGSNNLKMRRLFGVTQEPNLTLLYNIIMKIYILCTIHLI